MGLRITTLSENTAGAGDLLAEWGLSFLIETGQETILFDAGKTVSTSHNAAGLGIDLGRIDKIVLSHGHSDHTGGLRHLLRSMRREVEIIAHPGIWSNKYRRREGKKDRYVGIPFQRQELESLGARFTLTSEPVRVTEDIITTGEVPMVTAYETMDPGLFIKQDNGWQRDDLLDDLALVINTASGLVVVSGCAHRGIINTLFRARELTGTEKIHAVLGGAHLIDAPGERIRRTISAFKEIGVKKLRLCHCTSLPAISQLAHEFSDSFFFNITGTVFELA